MHSVLSGSKCAT